MSQENGKPSTQARRIAYYKLAGLRRMLNLIFYGKAYIIDDDTWIGQVFDEPFNEYIQRHLPKDKIGGLARTLNSRQRRKKLRKSR